MQHICALGHLPSRLPGPSNFYSFPAIVSTKYKHRALLLHKPALLLLHRSLLLLGIGAQTYSLDDKQNAFVCLSD